MTDKQDDKQTISLSNDTFSIHDSEIIFNSKQTTPAIFKNTRNILPLSPITKHSLFHIRNKSEGLVKKKEEVYDSIKQSFIGKCTTDGGFKQHRLETLRTKINCLGNEFKTEAYRVPAFRIKLTKTPVFKPAEIKAPKSQAVNINYNKNIAIQNKLNATSSLLNTYFNTNIKFKGSPVNRSRCFNNLYESIKPKRGTSTCW
jgi:hypothetical protein